MHAADDADDEAAARGGEVDGQGARRADGGLHRARGSEQVVGGGGGEEDEVEISAATPAAASAFLDASAASEVSDSSPEMTCLLPMPVRANPLVVGVDELGEIVVGEVLRRDGHPDAGDLRPRGGEGCAGDERRPRARDTRAVLPAVVVLRAPPDCAREPTAKHAGRRGHRQRRHRRDPSVFVCRSLSPLSRVRPPRSDPFRARVTRESRRADGRRRPCRDVIARVERAMRQPMSGSAGGVARGELTPQPDCHTAARIMDKKCS